MRLVLVLMTYSVLILQEARAETYMGETNLQEKVLKDAIFMGPTELKEVRAESLSVKGPLTFFNLIVKNTKIEGPITKSENGKFGPLKIMGPFTAKNIICKTLEVMGPVDITRLKVEGDTNIIGPLKASESQFKNVSILADEIFLENVEIKNISVKENNNDKDRQQVIQLKGKTLVNGSITFESGKGVVEQGPEVKVQGKIKGATVEKK